MVVITWEENICICDKSRGRSNLSCAQQIDPFAYEYTQRCLWHIVVLGSLVPCCHLTNYVGPLRS